MDFNYSDKYALAFADFAKRKFNERMYPKEIIEEWEGFVKVVKDGYDDIPPEYDNDLGNAREPLNAFLIEDSLNSFPEHEIFKEIIYQIDKMFIELTQEYPEWSQSERKWWDKRVPKYAGRNYVEFFPADELKRIGLTIQIND